MILLQMITIIIWKDIVMQKNSLKTPPEEKSKRDNISQKFIQSKGKSNWYSLTEEEKR